MSKIAYKWVVKEGSKYFPLVNYGVDGGKIRNMNPYILKKWNKNPIDYTGGKRIKQNKTILDDYDGYHLFKEPKPMIYNNINKDIYQWWTDFLKRINKKDIKITITKCEYDQVIADKGNRLVVKKFRILEELNY